MAKAGRKSKSEFISTSLPPEATPPRVRQKYTTDEERRKAKSANEKRSKDKRRERERLAAAMAESEDGDSLLQAMRLVYRDMGGASALLTHMKANPKDYSLMVQNLLKIEASLEETRLKKTGGEEPKGIFIVMKNLYDGSVICPHCHKDVNVAPDDVLKDEAPGLGLLPIDMKSMEYVLNPGADIAIREGGEWE
jgi:uncharacterized Zn finger protein (UPF0148 family)